MTTHSIQVTFTNDMVFNAHVRFALEKFVQVLNKHGSGCCVGEFVDMQMTKRTEYFVLTEGEQE